MSQAKPEVVLFVLPGCVHCKNAEEILKDQLKSGKVEKKLHTEAKDHQFRGFPALVRLSDGAISLGCPKSYSELHKTFDKSDTKLTPAQKMKLNKIKPILKKSRNINSQSEKKVIINEKVEKEVEIEPIIFFNMETCGFCARGKQLLSEEIKSGQIIVRPHTEAPQGIMGFPTFKYGDNIETGLPKSFEELASKLKYHSGHTKTPSVSHSSALTKPPTQTPETAHTSAKSSITENFIIKQEEQKQLDIKQIEASEQNAPLIPLEENNNDVIAETYISSNKAKGKMPLKNYVKPSPAHERKLINSEFIGVL